MVCAVACVCCVLRARERREEDGREWRAGAWVLMGDGVDWWEKVVMIGMVGDKVPEMDVRALKR